jgi:TatD DNase family protein
VTFIDSHCHLDDRQFDDDRDAAVERALAAGVECMLSIGTGEGPPDLESAIRLAEKYDAVLATVGIHPEHAPNAADTDFDKVRDLLQHPKVVAVGEIGLDYYWQPVHRDEQHRVFIRQLEIAREARKPISIHTRDAWDDTFALLEQHWDGRELPCVLHCFGGGPEIAQKALARGYYLSFAGVVTFPKAVNVHGSAKMAPLDRILVETDAPYLAPVPRRGKRNEPSYVIHTARRIADLRGDDPGAFAEAVTRNFEHIFRKSRQG